MSETANTYQDVEQRILDSVLKSDIAARLAAVPLDDRPELTALLGSIVKVLFYEERSQGEWLVVGLRGYVGKEEYSNEPRTVWERGFSPPIPSIAKVKDACGSTEVFTVSVDGVGYKFSKADGVYLGCTQSASTA